MAVSIKNVRERFIKFTIDLLGFLNTKIIELPKFTRLFLILILTYKTFMKLLLVLILAVTRSIRTVSLPNMTFLLTR